MKIIKPDRIIVRCISCGKKGNCQNMHVPSPGYKTHGYLCHTCFVAYNIGYGDAMRFNEGRNEKEIDAGQCMDWVNRIYDQLVVIKSYVRRGRL